MLCSLPVKLYRPRKRRGIHGKRTGRSSSERFDSAARLATEHADFATSTSRTRSRDCRNRSAVGLQPERRRSPPRSHAMDSILGQTTAVVRFPSIRTWWRRGLNRRRDIEGVLIRQAPRTTSSRTLFSATLGSGRKSCLPAGKAVIMLSRSRQFITLADVHLSSGVRIRDANEPPRCAKHTLSMAPRRAGR